MITEIEQDDHVSVIFLSKADGNLRKVLVSARRYYGF
jgi:hypothetical protein